MLSVVLLSSNGYQLGPHALQHSKNSDVGSSFECGVHEPGLPEEVSVGAIKAVIACQLAAEMKQKNLSKTRVAKLMKTSRTQVTRLLDPENGNVTIETLQRAARIVGRELRMELI
jgi:antitoxin HicB